MQGQLKFAPAHINQITPGERFYGLKGKSCIAMTAMTRGVLGRVKVRLSNPRTLNTLWGLLCCQRYWCITKSGWNNEKGGLAPNSLTLPQICGLIIETIGCYMCVIFTMCNQFLFILKPLNMHAVKSFQPDNSLKA